MYAGGSVAAAFRVCQAITQWFAPQYLLGQNTLFCVRGGGGSMCRI